MQDLVIYKIKTRSEVILNVFLITWYSRSVQNLFCGFQMKLSHWLFWPLVYCVFMIVLYAYGLNLLLYTVNDPIY